MGRVGGARVCRRHRAPRAPVARRSHHPRASPQARRVGDEHGSPSEAWGNASFREALVRHALQDCGRGGASDGLSPHALREAVYHVHGKEATGFKQSLALSVLRLLRARRVLDISAGWGDRLVAAIAVGVER